MNHDLYKMLFDKNPDGSVTYSMEDLEVITQEDNKQQADLRELILQDYTVLLEEIRKRIIGIATFADNNEKTAVRILYEYDNSNTPCAVVSIYLWGEKLNDALLFVKEEKIGNWTCSEASSHNFNFSLPVTKDIYRQASHIEFGIPLL